LSCILSISINQSGQYRFSLRSTHQLVVIPIQSMNATDRAFTRRCRDGSPTRLCGDFASGRRFLDVLHLLIIDLWRRTGITIFMITHDVEEAVFLSNRIFALGARPGTVRRVLNINLPERATSVKRHSTFHDYRDELMDLLRKHGQEAVTV